MRKPTLLAAWTLATAFPAVVLAHPGHGVGSLGNGLAHPLTGIDHMLALIAVGLLAAPMQSSIRWVLPVGMLGAILLGGFAATAGIAVPLVEAAIVASVLVGGLLLMFQSRPQTATAVMVSAFGLFHGYAHVSESAGPVASYVSGILLTSVAIIAVTMGTAMLISRIRSEHAALTFERLAGVALSLSAVALMLGVA